MPLTNVKEYLSQVLDVDALLTDIELVHQMNKVLDDARVQPMYLPRLEKLELAMRECEMFKKLEDKQKKGIVKRVKELANKDEAAPEKDRRLRNELFFNEYTRLLADNDDQALLTAWVKFRNDTARVRLRKRDMKNFEKEARALLMYGKGIKPIDIAKAINKTPAFVSTLVHRLQHKFTDRVQRGLCLSVP